MGSQFDGPVNVYIGCCDDVPGTTPPPTTMYVVSVDGHTGILNLDGQGAIEIGYEGTTNTITFSLSASAGLGTVTQVATTQPAAGLTITGGPINTTGTFLFALANDLAALEGLSSTGFSARTASDTWAQRLLQAPAAGITITNPAGIAGNPTFALSDDLAAVEGLASTGITARTGSSTWSVRTLQPPAAGFTITNPGGVGGDPTFALDGDLAAVEGLSGVGWVKRTSGTPTWTTTGFLEIETNNMVWVDEDGDDDTGTVGFFDKPFENLMPARDAASSGDTIVVRPGAYTCDESLAKDGVNWYFEPGASVTFTDDASTAGIWDDGGVAMTFTVDGYGDFVRQKATVSGGVSWATVSVNNAGSVITIRGRDFTSESEVVENYHGPVFAGAGRLYLSARKLIALGENGGTAYGIWWANCDCIVNVDEIISEYSGIYSAASGSTAWNCFVNVSNIEAVRAIWNASGDNNVAGLWLRAGILKCSEDAMVIAAPQRTYVTAQKLFGSVRALDSAGLLYVTTDKLSAVANGGFSTAALFHIEAGTVRLEVKEYDPVTFTGQMMKVTGGTAEVIGGRYVGINGSDGVEVVGGTVLLESLILNTAASILDNPILKSGGTLKINNCILIAHSIRDSIEASGLQTVQIQTPCSATTDVDGSITLSPNAGYFINSSLT